MFKKCKVVMLPTNEKAVKQGQLVIGAGNYLFSSRQSNNIGSLTAYELYITSNEEIKEGDYSIGDEGIFGPYEKNDILPSNSKKIIATTDTILGLHQPSQRFIEKYIEEYNKGNIITDVLVEYEQWTEFSVDHHNTPTINKLKVNPKDNTITIKKVKDGYSKKEVNELFEKYDFEIKRFGILDEYKYNYLEIWKKENL